MSCRRVFRGLLQTHEAERKSKDVHKGFGDKFLLIDQFLDGWNQTTEERRNQKLDNPPRDRMDSQAPNESAFVHFNRNDKKNNMADDLEHDFDQSGEDWTR